MALQQETAKLGEALALLPANQRELIEKAYFGDLSHGEIAGSPACPWARSSPASGWRWKSCARP
jgi:DNA-directed RNA polymerase specialized sigma24 family protein